MRGLPSFVCTLWLLASAPVAADLELGLQAHRQGDHAEALRQWLPMAEQGQAEAQYRVGRLYYYGHGVAQDYEEAACWYRRAAEQGHARSQSNLGFLYENGRGVARDDGEAAGWYRKAADGGRAMAQFHLGRLYEEGRGVPQDQAEAARLFASAARQRHAEAMSRLARMYDEGRGVPRDPKKARRWHRRAAKRGAETAAATDAGDDVEEAPPPVSSEAPAISVEVLGPETGAKPVGEPAVLERPPIETEKPPAADEPPVHDLADGIEAYERGDHADALRIWLPLAQRGDAEAQYRLGNLYRVGQGVEQDPAEAGRWLLRAAENDHPLAVYGVAFLYLRGRGVSERPDPVRAYAWLSIAAARGIGDAASWLDKLGRKMTEREIAQARDLVREWQGE